MRLVLPLIFLLGLAACATSSALPEDFDASFEF